MSKEYYFHADPGHAWLAVKRKELVRLNILNKISPFSYQKGGTVYLEEDCDASIFLNAKKALGEEVAFKETHLENTPIRNYQNFKA
jgi:hypothetical protein